MDLRDKIILVSGATGHQGGATARKLLEQRCRVRILTRDPDKPAAREFIGMGATAVKGSFDEPESLREALKGCYGAFSVQDFYTAGFEGEIRQGTDFADAAAEAGVEHFIYSSVGSADKRTSIPHFETKWQIEEHVRSLDMNWTILRPVFFMDNFSAPNFRAGIMRGVLSNPMRPDKPLQMIAVDDIGAIAALAFAKGEECYGRAFDIAGDELTMEQAAQQFSEVLGQTVRFQQAPLDELKKSMPGVATMFQWFNDVGYSADIERVREFYPGLLTFNAWLKQSAWAGQRAA